MLLHLIQSFQVLLSRSFDRCCGSRWFRLRRFAYSSNPRVCPNGASKLCTMNETFEEQCQQIMDFRRVHGGRAPCRSRSDLNEDRLGCMKSNLKRRCQKALGVKPGQSKLTPEQSSHLDWCLSDEAMQAADCRAPSDHSDPGTHVNNDENPSSPNKRLRTRAAKKKAEIQQRNIGSGSTTTVNQ